MQIISAIDIISSIGFKKIISVSLYSLQTSFFS